MKEYVFVSEKYTKEEVVSVVNTINKDHRDFLRKKQLQIEDLLNNNKHLFKVETGTTKYLIEQVDKIFNDI